MEPVAEGETEGLAPAAVVNSSAQVRNVFRGVILAYIRVARFHAELFGWTTPRWEATVRRCFDRVRHD